MHRFTNRPACSGFLQQELGLDGTSLPDWLLEVFTEHAKDVPKRDQPANSLNLQLASWVVRDQDLDVFRAVRETFMGFASGHFAFSGLGEAALSGIVFGVLGLVRRAQQAGASVSPLQARILMILRSSRRQPLAVDAIDVGLRLGGLSLSQGEIRDALQQLTEVPTLQGPQAFVQKLSNGAWMTTGV